MAGVIAPSIELLEASTLPHQGHLFPAEAEGEHDPEEVPGEHDPADPSPDPGADGIRCDQVPRNADTLHSYTLLYTQGHNANSPQKQGQNPRGDRAPPVAPD